VLGWVGVRIYQMAPPLPDQVVSTDGKVIFERGAIARGQDVWRALGGMELGSVWGHGAYVAPDWTADWLHRELVAVLDRWSTREHGRPYEQLGAAQQAALRERLRHEYRENVYDAERGQIVVSPDRAQAIEDQVAHYTALFRDGR